jgi:hypothetical protein
MNKDDLHFLVEHRAGFGETLTLTRAQYEAVKAWTFGELRKDLAHGPRNNEAEELRALVLRLAEGYCSCARGQVAYEAVQRREPVTVWPDLGCTLCDEHGRRERVAQVRVPLQIELVGGTVRNTGATPIEVQAEGLGDGHDTVRIGPYGSFTWRRS